MKTFLLLVTTLQVMTLAGQSLSGDSILANERSIDRPITLHARQIRATGSYGLAVISRRYDAGGDVIRLRNEGLSSVRHRFTWELKYGVSDFIQLQLSGAYASQAVREQTRYVIPLDPELPVVHDVLTENRGMEDIFAGVDFRAPFSSRKFDLALTAGAFLPLAQSDPRRPEHTTKPGEIGTFPSVQYTYRYDNALGRGVPIILLGGMTKLRTRHWAFAVRVDYMHGMKDGASFRWRHQLTENDQFEYRKDPFTFRLPDSYTAWAEIEYQPLPWFDVFVNVWSYQAAKGWTSPQDNLRIGLPKEVLTMVYPGFEIIVTPRLWLRERFGFPLAGKNSEAALQFHSTIQYNLFIP